MLNYIEIGKSYHYIENSTKYTITIRHKIDNDLVAISYLKEGNTESYNSNLHISSILDRSENIY